MQLARYQLDYLILNSWRNNLLRDLVEQDVEWNFHLFQNNV